MPKFRPYNQNQLMLLPPDLRECLPHDHISFLVDEVVNGLDISFVEETYKENGSPAYDPQMLLKVLFYSYRQGIRSSRKIEARLYEDIVYRFLSANQQPDHGTISLFRKTHLSKLNEIFAQIVILCNGLGMVNLKSISIDGTKVKASASKKRTHDQKQIKELEQQIKDFLEESQRVDEEEDRIYGKERGYNQMPGHLLDPKVRAREIEKAKQELEKLNQAEKTIEQKQAQAKTKKEKEQTRNRTINLTDPNANLMKMKDGSFKPAYNVQLAASRQVIVAYDLTDRPEDTGHFRPMIEQVEKITGQEVEEAKADAAYSTKADLKYCQERKIDDYIPDQRQSIEERQERENNVPKYDRRNFVYNQEKDQFRCPQGKILKFQCVDKEKGRKYLCQDCSNCPAKIQCTKGQYRYLYVDFEYEELKTKMRKKLKSKKGKRKYLERLSEIEPVIGNIKVNQGVNQFYCRGKPKVLIELGLISIAHNLVKIFNGLKKKNKNNQRIQIEYFSKVKEPCLTGI